MVGLSAHPNLFLPRLEMGEMPVRMRRSLLGYMPVDSPIYRLHPATRLLFLLVVSAYPMLIRMPELNVLGSVFMLILYKVARVDLTIIKNYKMAFLNLFFVIAIAYTFFGGYRPEYRVLAELGPVKICWENLRWAIVVYIQLIFAILIMIFFLSTTRERDVVVGLRALRIPFVLSYMAGLALRSIGLSIIDFNTIREAEKARALDLDALPFSEKVKKFGMYIVPLVALAIRRSDEVSNALDSRGFSYSGLKTAGRTDYILSRYRMTRLDYLVLALMALFFAGIVISQLAGWFRVEDSLLYRL